MVTSEKLRDRGYTPSIRELDGLLELLGSDEDTAKLAEGAILRIEAQHRAKIAAGIVRHARAASRPGRGRLTRFAGRFASEGSVTAWLLEAVRDADLKTRRAAARALGNLASDVAGTETHAAIEAALVGAWDACDDDKTGDEDRRALADALGKVGGSEARARLAAAPAGAKESATRASLIADRTASRSAPGAIDLESIATDVPIRFHTRSGLEVIAATELGDAWRPRVKEKGRVEAVLRGALSNAAAVRTATHFGFPLESVAVARKDDETLARAIVASLTSERSLALLRAHTRGSAIRFRLAWKSGGHRRALAWKCAERIREASSELVNDPTASTWEVFVDDTQDGGARLELELVPRGFEDKRFVYRRGLVSASSHPTIAAALALAAPRRHDDIVWDPFVGAGAELVERALVGPYAELYGTDIDERAVRSARENLAAAGVTGATITRSDARVFAKELSGRVTLIVTNPPMGRRVERGTHQDLLGEFIAAAGAALVPSGSLVWMVPEPKRIQAHTERAGLRLVRSWVVDMGGFPAELAIHQKAGGKGRGRRDRGEHGKDGKGGEGGEETGSGNVRLYRSRR